MRNGKAEGGGFSESKEIGEWKVFSFFPGGGGLEVVWTSEWVFGWGGRGDEKVGKGKEGKGERWERGKGGWRI